MLPVGPVRGVPRYTYPRVTKEQARGAQVGYVAPIDPELEERNGTTTRSEAEDARSTRRPYSKHDTLPNTVHQGFTSGSTHREHSQPTSRFVAEHQTLPNRTPAPTTQQLAPLRHAATWAGTKTTEKQIVAPWCWSNGKRAMVSHPGFDAVLIPWPSGRGEGDCRHGTSIEVHTRVPASSDRGGS